MRNPLLIPDLQEIIRDGQAASLAEFFADYQPPRIAEMMEDFAPAEQMAILEQIEPKERGEVFSYLDLETQVHLAESRLIANLGLEPRLGSSGELTLAQLTEQVKGNPWTVLGTNKAAK